MKVYNTAFDQERALYNLVDSTVEKCSFEGPADGESALKECRNIQVVDTNFALRYPLWHGKDFYLGNCTFTDTCRAPLWYDQNGNIVNCNIMGVKALRECINTRLSKCEISSQEFGWKCAKLQFSDCKINATYFLLLSKGVCMNNCTFTGKYSFQYVEDTEIFDCVLDTKDAFWHAKNVVVRNCVVKGEYLGWYSENLTFINCKIEGTQPLCYCKKLKLIDCTMENCDLSFEYSDVDATINGYVQSIKNPKSGKIVADQIGEIIESDSIVKTSCKITVR